MLWFDGKGISHFKNEVQELLKIPKALMERFTKWANLNCFLVRIGEWPTCSFF